MKFVRYRAFYSILVTNITLFLYSFTSSFCLLLILLFLIFLISLYYQKSIKKAAFYRRIRQSSAMAQHRCRKQCIYGQCLTEKQIQGFLTSIIRQDSCITKLQFFKTKFQYKEVFLNQSIVFKYYSCEICQYNRYLRIQFQNFFLELNNNKIKRQQLPSIYIFQQIELKLVQQSIKMMNQIFLISLIQSDPQAQVSPQKLNNKSMDHLFLAQNQTAKLINILTFPYSNPFIINQILINVSSSFKASFLNIIISQESFAMMLKNGTTPQLNFHKIHFTVRKKVRFGQAIYVCGDISQLGLWWPERAYRLRWNQGNIWTNSLLLTHEFPEMIEYKYIIANWDNPSFDEIQWEAGDHNRKMDIGLSKTITLCDDKWNMDRIRLCLLTPKHKKAQEQQFYVTGDINEIGNWKQKRSMKKLIKKNTPLKFKEDYQAQKSSQGQQQEIYTYSFSVFRGREQFYYYYIKKGDVFQSERKPGRVLRMNNQDAYHPYRMEVSHTKGQIVVVDECNIDELVFSKITNQIFVGSFLKSSLDMLRLKQQNITSILSIQSEKDFCKNGLTPHYLSLLCQQNGIKYKRYSIKDMNNQDFVNRAEGAVKIMNDLLRNEGKVYVHCSAGKYRSPQIIALYLSVFQSYQIEEAVCMIKSKHPFAKPNCKVIHDALGVIQMREAKRRVYY